MDDRKWDAMDDRALEQLLESGLAGLPPDEVVRGVTPWKKAMDRILWGMALGTLTLNFACLNYILPALGVVLTLLGARSLRNENRWFKGLFVLAAARAALFFPVLVLNATIWNALLPQAVSWALTAAGLLVPLGQYVCLWRGLRAVKEKAGLPPRAGSAGALLVWYGLLCALGLLQYSGLVLFWGMVAAWILIFRSLFQCSRELDEAGYALRPAPVRMTDRALVLALAGALALGLAGGYTFCDGYPMDYTPVEEREQDGLEDIKAHLLELGFPEHVLADLAPEDIRACEGALRVVVQTADHPVNDGRMVTTEWEDEEGRHTEYDVAYDVKELCLTAVAVEVPGEKETWVLIHHFRWNVDPGFYGTEAIQLWPSYRMDSWDAAGEATGRVLCDRDGVRYGAPYYFLGPQTYTANGIFWGEQTRSDLFAAFSLPKDGENCRGYVAYPIREVEDGWYVDSWINYTHQEKWFQYPVQTAMGSRMDEMAGSWDRSRAFRLVQDALQFFPGEADEG